MDKIKFDTGMRTLIATLNCSMSKEEIITMERVYFVVMEKEGFTDEMFSDCINRLMRTWKPEFGRKFPTVNNFLDIAGKTPEKIAEKAFTAVRSAILNVGAYEPLLLGREHRHAVAHEVVRRLGGWVQVAQGGIIDFDSKREKFLKMYIEMYFEKIENRPLMGMIEQKNKNALENFIGIAKIPHRNAQALSLETQ